MNCSICASLTDNPPIEIPVILHSLYFVTHFEAFVELEFGNADMSRVVDMYFTIYVRHCERNHVAAGIWFEICILTRVLKVVRVATLPTMFRIVCRACAGMFPRAYTSNAVAFSHLADVFPTEKWRNRTQHKNYTKMCDQMNSLKFFHTSFVKWTIPHTTQGHEKLRI